jgi:hypothetical protein
LDGLPQPVVLHSAALVGLSVLVSEDMVLNKY